MKALASLALVGLLPLQLAGCAAQSGTGPRVEPAASESTGPRCEALFALEDDAQEPMPATAKAITPALSEAEELVIREQVLEELRAYYKDFSARDWPAFRAHFWPGANITGLGQPKGESRERVVVTPVETYIEQIEQEGPAVSAVFEQTIVESKFQVSRDLAQVWIRYNARFGSPGEVMEWTGNEAFTLLFYDDSWRIAALVVGSDR